LTEKGHQNAVLANCESDALLLQRATLTFAKIVSFCILFQQIELANRHVDYHTKLFGYEKANIKFVKGYIENLSDAGIDENSIDILM